MGRMQIASNTREERRGSATKGCSHGFDGGFSYDRESIMGPACKKLLRFNPTDIEIECEVTTEWELIEE